jgi:hypothetical protein
MFLILLAFLFVPDNSNILGHYISGISYLTKKHTQTTPLHEVCDDFLLVPQDTIKNLGSDISVKAGVTELFMPPHLVKEKKLHGKELNSAINFEKREQWYKSALEELISEKTICTYENIRIQEYIAEEFLYYKKYIKLSKDKPYKLVFSDGSFLVFTCHSVYDSPEIGDITIAVNEKNIVYKNEGHICGGMISFVTFQNKEVTTSHDFIRNFKSDTDFKSWIILKR